MTAARKRNENYTLSSMDCDVVVQSRVDQCDDEQEIVSCHDRLLVDGQASQPQIAYDLP